MKLFSSKTLLATAMSVVFAVSTFSAASAAPMSRKPQDNLFYATSTEPLGLDPALVDDNDSGNINCNIYESLLKFKADNTEIEPSLAESWTISDDGLTYVFKLRQGVKFHDGTPFNAQAVKFNIDRQMPENLVPKMSYAPLVFGDVQSTKVIDDYTIEIKLKKRSTPFLRNMAMCFAAPIASPDALKKFNNNLMENPVGTGPYKLVAWDKGQQLILTTNEDYWGKKPAVQNVIYKIMKETSARVVALNNGEVDIINGIDANVIDQLKQGGSKIFEAEGNNVNYMVYNCRDGYLTADREVRKALAQAINVPEMVQSLYKGYATFAPSFFPTFMSGYDPNVKAVTYDPEAAKKFLAEKGIKELRILTYSNARYYNTVGGQVLAEAVQAYFDKVGVKAKVDVYDWTTFKSKLLTDKWDITFIGWVGDNGDPDNFINILAANDPISNQGLWQNKEFIEIIEKATHVADGPERIALYQKAEAVLAEDVGVLPISHAKTLAAYRPNIEGKFTHPIGLNFFDQVKKN